MACPLLMVSLIEVLDKIEDDTHVWLSIFAIPALLTTAVGVLVHRSGAEIAVAAVLSGGLSALTVLLTILHAFGAFP